MLHAVSGWMLVVMSLLMGMSLLLDLAEGRDFAHRRQPRISSWVVVMILWAMALRIGVDLL